MGHAHGESTAFASVFTGGLGQIQPFRCFSCNLECCFFFSLNAIFVGNAGDGKDAPWELMGVNWGEKNVEKASYPGWDHIRL